MKLTPWLLPQSGLPRRIRLYCFCYAGGSAAAFSSWQALLGSEIEVCAVQLPGRGARICDKPYTSLTSLIKALAEVIAEQKRLPFAFFGHSLGGLIAFELARFCKKNYLPMPLHLFTSGSAAPQYRSPSRNLHVLPDDALIDALRDYNGTPPEILEHRELMELVLPTIRADFALVENYEYKPGIPLTIPITVLAGKLDEHLSREQAQGWQKETTNICRIQWFEGDHFFINPEQSMVLNCVRTTLTSQINARGPLD